MSAASVKDHDLIINGGARMPEKTKKSLRPKRTAGTIPPTKARQKAASSNRDIGKTTSSPRNFAAKDALPKSYGGLKVVLMPVDPFLMHAYWEADLSDVGKATRRFEGKFRRIQTVLRFFDVTNDPSGSSVDGYFDVPVDLEAGGWYVHHLIPGRAYFADLGVKAEGGIFVPLIRSNTAETPMDKPDYVEPEACLFVSKEEAPMASVKLSASMNAPNRMISSLTKGHDSRSSESCECQKSTFVLTETIDGISISGDSQIQHIFAACSSFGLQDIPDISQTSEEVFLEGIPSSVISSERK